MRIGDIYKNLWAGYETYFVYTGKAIRNRRVPSTCTQGYGITRIGENWHFETVVYDRSSLMDSMHFPVVGHIDLDKQKDLFVESILKNVRQRYREEPVRACEFCRNAHLADAPCNRCVRNKHFADFFNKAR